MAAEATEQLVLGGDFDGGYLSPSDRSVRLFSATQGPWLHTKLGRVVIVFVISHTQRNWQGERGLDKGRC